MGWSSPKANRESCPGASCFPWDPSPTHSLSCVHFSPLPYPLLSSTSQPLPLNADGKGSCSYPSPLKPLSRGGKLGRKRTATFCRPYGGIVPSRGST